MADIRDDINAAIEKSEAPAAPTTPEPTTPPAEVTPPTTPEKPATPPEEKPATPPEEKPAAQTEEEKVRDETKTPVREADGKFGKKKEETKPEAKPATPAEPEKPQLPKSRAPGSWTAAAREKWTSIPADIQQQILRREKDISNGFNEIGKLRKFGEDFAAVIAPFQHIIAAEGGQPLGVVQNMMQTAASLYNGSPQQKVATVAAIIKNFNIDLPMLDSFLASGQMGEGGGGGGPGPTQTGQQDMSRMVQAAVQSALAPLLRRQQEETGRAEAEVQETLDTFANDPKNEFFDDVRETMADILELAAKRGEKMDLPTAYSRAILMHSDIAAVVTERQLREKAAAASSAAAAAKKKAVSVTGAPAKEPAARGESLRSDILGAMETLGT